MTETPLDVARAAMEKDDAARLAFYDRLSAAELFLMTIEEALGDTLSPETFETDEGTYVLAFDREDRLAAFAERTVPYAAVSGRALAGMLAGNGIGLALNPGVAPSSILIPPEAVAWLAETLDTTPEGIEARIAELTPPGDLPETLLSALDARLASAAGLARMAYLSGCTYEDGSRGHLLAIIDVVPGAERALARTLREAVMFSGTGDGLLDVAFFAAGDPIVASLARNGLRFDLPAPEMPEPPGAPGMDPDCPPRLQ